LKGGAQQQQQQTMGVGLPGGERPAGPTIMSSDEISDVNNIDMEENQAVPAPEEQARAIQSAEDRQIVAGEQMYIISRT
jgi:hypothetical protein